MDNDNVIKTLIINILCNDCYTASERTSITCYPSPYMHGFSQNTTHTGMPLFLTCN